MDSLDYKHYEPNQLDVEYDYNLQSPTEPNLETSTQSTSEELDQELEDLLLLMGGTDIPQHAVIDEAKFVDPVVEKVEWLNSNDLVDSKEFNYQPTPTDCSKYDQVPTCSSNKFNYQARHGNSSRLNSDYSSTTDRFNYSPSDQSNCNYQADHSSNKFDYQSDRTKFNHTPTHQNKDRFDYTPTEPKSFDRPSNPKNYSPLPHTQNYSGSSSHGGGVLDVQVDQNTRVRLEVGVSAEVGNGYAHAAAYAKATIYKRG